MEKLEQEEKFKQEINNKIDWLMANRDERKKKLAEQQGLNTSDDLEVFFNLEHKLLEDDSEWSLLSKTIENLTKLLGKIEETSEALQEVGNFYREKGSSLF